MQFWTDQPLENSKVFSEVRFDIEHRTSAKLMNRSTGTVWLVESDQLIGSDFEWSESRPPLLIVLLKNDLNLYTQILNQFQPDQLLTLADIASVSQTIEKLQSKALVRSKKRQFQKNLSDRNKELELLAGNLEKLVDERTQWIEASNREQRDLMRSDRRFVQFLIEMGFQTSKEDLLEYFLQEFRQLRLAQNIYLMNQEPSFVDVLYLKGQQIQVERVPEVWWTSEEIETLSENSNRALTKIISRPVGKLIAFPMADYFEISKSEKWAVVIERMGTTALSEFDFSSVKKHVQALGLTLEKLRLESDNRMSALRWEKVFDQALDPIAIISNEFDVLRSNDHFGDSQKNLKCYQIFAKRTKPCDHCPLVTQQLSAADISVVSRSFQVMSQPIEEDRSLFLHRYVDVTDIQGQRVLFIQNEKLSSIGQIAEQMAHEIYNPLAGILALVEILLAEKNLKETTRSDLVEIQKAAVRAQKVIENLQDFVSQETEVTAVTLDEIIEKTLPLLKMKWRSYRLNLDLKASQNRIHVQPQLISQVIYNLIQNACQAMPNGKTLHLKTYQQSQSVIMEVTDEGTGISDAIKGSIFKPFFTTKPTGEGTGLGLSLSKQFVERFGGQLTFQTVEGKGTTFKMELPI